MTKLIANRFILEYQKAMADLMARVHREIAISGIEPRRAGELQKDRFPSGLCGVDVLDSPRIEMLDVDFYYGQPNGLFFIQVSSHLPVVNVYVSIADGQGNLIEHGLAFEDPEGAQWVYVTNVPVRAGTPVVVTAAAEDRMSGIGIRSIRTTAGPH